MARSVEQVWDSGAAAAPESDSPSTEADSAPEPRADEKPRAAARHEQSSQSKPRVEAKRPDPEVDDEPDEPIPGDLDGIKTSLKAARGDARKHRKQWQEVGRSLSEKEGELRALRAQLEQYQRGPQVQPEKPKEPSPEDLDLQFYGGPTAYLNEQIKGAKSHAEEVTRSLNHNWSLRFAKQQYADFDEAYAAADKAYGNNSQFIDQVRAAQDPGEFIYRAGRNAMLVGQHGGDIEALIAAKRAEWEAERGTAPSTAPTQQPARPQSSPQTIARARGTSSATQREWSGPRSQEAVWDR